MQVAKTGIIDVSLNTQIGDFQPNYLLTRVSDPWNGFNPRSFLMLGSAHAAAVVHEMIHWTQFAATTWGHLCLLLNQCRGNFFADAAHHHDLKKILNEISSVKIDDNGAWSKPIGYLPQDSRLFAKSWRDTSVAHWLFIDGGEFFQVVNKSFSEEDLGAVLTDFFTEKLSYYGDEADEHILDLDKRHQVDRFSLLRGMDRTILGMKDLLEGQARANELLYMANTKEYDESDLKNLFTPTSPYNNSSLMPYWNLFYNFLNYRNVSIDNLQQLMQELTRFCLLIDIALNPPWPLSHELGRKSNIGTWNEFYPVNRFLHLLTNQRKSSSDFDWRSKNSHLKLVREACDSVGWPTPSELAEQFILKSTEPVARFKESWESTNFKSHAFFIRDYYHYIFWEFCHLRLKSPSYAPLPGLIYSHVIESELDFLGDGPEWLSSPLQMKLNSRTVYTNLQDKSAQFAWLSGSLIANEIMNKCVLQEESIRSELFPYDIPEFQQDQIAKSLSNTLKLPLTWQRENVHSLVKTELAQPDQSEAKLLDEQSLQHDDLSRTSDRASTELTQSTQLHDSYISKKRSWLVRLKEWFDKPFREPTRQSQSMAKTLTGERTAGSPFKVGNIFITAGAEDALKLAGVDHKNFLKRHILGDWGSVSDSTRELNKKAVKSKEGTILSVYIVNNEIKIWIYTNHIHSVTTILLPDEW